MKKFLSLVLAAMMLLAMASVAFAEGEETTTPAYTITVTNTNTANVSINGKTYSAYQIFAATVANNVVSYTTGDLAVTYNDKSGVALLENLSDMSNNSAEIRAFADYVYENYILNKEVTPAATGVAANETATIALNEAGYYLVFGDGAAVDGGSAVASLVMLNPVTSSNVTINPKFDAPTLDKEIKHNELGTWGDVGDNKIGDSVEYRIKTSVPDKTANFDEYDYIITDTMTAGLTFNNDLKIYTSDTISTENLLDQKYYTVTATTNPNGFTVDVDVKQAVADGALTAGSYIYSYYTCTLNENAYIYDEGSNDNTAYLEYSNNPYSDSQGKTNEVTVYDYTFSYTVNKVDTAGAPLAGAKFVLSTSANLGVLSLTADNKVIDANNAEVTNLISFNVANNVYTVNKDASDTSAVVVIGTDAGTTYEIDGLDDSVTYYLYEVKAPDNYNKLTAPVEITISASYTTDANGKQVLATGSPTSNSGSMAASIVNNFGAVLPSTGGIGTTLFYLFGGLMTAGSALILVVRRRADADEE